MRSALSFAVTTALAAAVARVPGEARPYLDGSAGTPTGTVRVIEPRPNARHRPAAAGADAEAPSRARRTGAGDRIIVPNPDAAASAADPVDPTPAPEAGVGGSGEAAPGAETGARVQELQHEVEALREQLAQQPSPGVGSLGERLDELQYRAEAIEQSREQRAALHAQVARLLGEAQLHLITGDGDVGAILDAAEARLYEAGSQAVALGPANEVVRAQGAVRAIDEARTWIENSDLWHARGSLDAAIFEAQAARRIANDNALPLVAPPDP